jgi:DNA mismatch repair protein MutS2
VELEKLLADMQNRTRALRSSQERLAAREQEREQELKDLRRRLKGIDKERRSALADARRLGEELVQEGRREIERAVREIRSGGAARETVRAAHQRLQALARRLPPPPPQERSGPPPEVGDRVRIPHLGLTGQVVEARGDRLVALADGLRLNLTADAVEVVGQGPGGAGGGADPALAAAPTDRGGWRWHDGPPDISPEIDLRGERAEEGWQRLDRLIDRAIPAGLNRIHVVHGVGTGRLREHLWRRLQADPRVAGVRPAGPGPGQLGATVVELVGDGGG